MPQGPIPVQQVPSLTGTKSNLYISTPTAVKSAPGYIARVVVLVAGSATGTVNDCLTSGAAVTANEIAVIPETVGPVVLEFPCLTGIFITPGTGQVVSVSYV